MIPSTHPAPDSTAPLTQPPRTKPLPFKRLWIPLLIQVALILAVPAQAIYTSLTGRTIVLQTRPVDPYDLLRGYFQTLDYTISDPQTLKTLPGWDSLHQQAAIGPQALPTGTQFYVILEAPASLDDDEPPTPWKPVEVSAERPNALPANRVALKGRIDSSWAEYGLETYYMPEDRRQQMNQEIGQIQRDRQPFVVEVKVDKRGHAIPESLWINNKNYQF